MKNNKGFTLLELLAVILVLGIIALVAITQVNKIVEESRKQAIIASATNYIKAVNNKIGVSRLDINQDNHIKDGVYVPSSLNVKVDGESPKRGMVTVENGLVVSSTFLYGNYKITCDSENKCTAKKANFLYLAEPGLYDYDNKRLIATWDTLVKYGLDIEANGVATGCNILTNKGLEGTLVLPQTVTKLGSLKFRKCSALKGIYIPASVTKISSEALRQSGIDFIYFENVNNWYAKLESGDTLVDVSNTKNVTEKIKRDTASNQYPLVEWYNKTN